MIDTLREEVIRALYSQGIFTGLEAASIAADAVIEAVDGWLASE